MCAKYKHFLWVAFAIQAWPPEFNLEILCKCQNREPIPQSCHLTSRYANTHPNTLPDTHAHTPYAHIHTQKH